MKSMFVKFLEEIEEPKLLELGGKGYSLAVLVSKGFNVPRGFVILSEAFFNYLRQNNMMEMMRKLSSEINENNFREKSREIKGSIFSGKIPREVVREVEVGLRKLNAKFVSVRSSAVSEDSLKASFAGLHDTFLNTKAETNSILENVKKCWASLFNERAIIYRIKKKIPHLEGMAVIIQEMIPSEVSGVVFTTHPMNDKFLLIEASYGIGDMVVGGRVEPDGYVIDRETLKIVERKIGKKNMMTVIKGEEIKAVNVIRELAERQALSDEKIREIAEISLRVEKIFAYPQDIEWCMKNDKVWLLQSRAITEV
jgi:phosphoenolpyruvate synthase/pyruvate phosphate dikinase